MTSVYALILLGLGKSRIAETIASTLFPLQIVYKLATKLAAVPAVGLNSPVVVSNIVMAVVLSTTLWILA